MEKAVGVDACRIGWAVAVQCEDSLTLQIHPSIEEVWTAQRNAGQILIDIPIGLPDCSERTCDLEARRFLAPGPRQRSVFMTPVRDVLDCGSYEEACTVNAQQTGKKISKQCWNIVPRIREVDTLLAADPAFRARTRECHPEVCFEALAGQPMAHSKKTPEGLRDRLAVLERHAAGSHDLVQTVADQHPKKDVAHDDLLDALVLAITASLPENQLRSLPASPPCDTTGLPMQIIYPHTSEIA